MTNQSVERTGVMQAMVNAVIEGNDYDIESPGEEEPLLQRTDEPTKWKAPRGLFWIEVGMYTDALIH